MTKRWCSIREAAAYFSIPAGTLYSLNGRGRLPKGSVLRLGRALRFDIQAIENGAAIKRLR